jgi:hypothetical protein
MNEAGLSGAILDTAVRPGKAAMGPINPAGDH